MNYLSLVRDFGYSEFLADDQYWGSPINIFTFELYDSWVMLRLLMIRSVKKNHHPWKVTDYDDFYVVLNFPVMKDASSITLCWQTSTFRARLFCRHF